jgi:MFS family permease
MATLLNPLNSSMIAVALVDLQRDFGVGFAASSWLVSGFYLTAGVAQPVMGRLADRFGPRRVLCTGLTLVAATGVLVLFAPGFGWVLSARLLQAVGSSVGFPAGLAMIRRLAGGRPPAATLGTISATNAASAALGPVLGGVLVAVFGWQGIFAANIPLAGLALWAALRWLPRDQPAEACAPVPAGPHRHSHDQPTGAGMAVPAGLGRLSHERSAEVGVAGPAVSVGLGRGSREQPAEGPAVGPVTPAPTRSAAGRPDLRELLTHRGLLGVLGQQIATQCVFYMVFFGLPQWLERVRGYSSATTGLLILPVAALGVVLTPAAARLIRQVGAGVSLLVGAGGLVLGSALLLSVGEQTAPLTILAVCAVLGLPVAFNNIGLQAGLYAAAPVAHVGTAAGLFQTGRYVGATLSTLLLGLVAGAEPSSAGLHRVGWFVIVVGLALASVALSVPAPGGRHRPERVSAGPVSR